MEALVELLIELVVEVFGQIIFEVLSAAIANFSSYIHVNTKAKKILKYSIAAVVFSATLVLLILALCYKTTIYVEIVVSYFIVLLITYILKYISKNIWKNPTFERTILWVNRGIHYAFPIVLIVFASINVNKATPVIISFSAVALVVYLCINIYRIYFSRHTSSYNKFLFKYKKLLKELNNDSMKKRKILYFLYRNQKNYYTFLQKDIEEDDVKLLNQIFRNLSKTYQSMLFIQLIEDVRNRFDCCELDEEIRIEKERLKKSQ